MNYQELLHSPIIPFQIVTLIQKTAHNNVPVLIQGEQGTEKELVAKIIHYIGDWKYYRFYKIDCKILTEDTFGDQLSHLFKEINYGAIPATLYLKEVGHLGLVDQQNLLELIEDSVFQNGTEKKVVKNIRFVSSSSENVKEKITQGKFSEDLYYRLNTLTIPIPPLRQRANEISTIAHYILTEYCKKMKIRKAGISNNVLILLQNYWWPGNLRELEHVIIRSAIFSDGETITEKALFFETENERNSFISFLKQGEMKPAASQKKSYPEEQNNYSLSLFIIELVHRIKNPLVSIKTFTQLLREKFGDAEFREYFYRIVNEDIERIDAVLNGLLNYIKINTPLEKTNTVHYIIEDVLKKHEVQLEDKKIRIFKKFEKDLPETVVHDEQLRYIFNSLLQYAIPSIPPNGSIGFLTKSFNVQKQTGDDKSILQKDGRYIEILIVFTGYKKPVEQLESVLGIPTIKKEESIELELRLIKEIIEKNKGMIKLEINEKKPRTLISLKLPIERRKVIYYQSTNA
jgi:nitrogen-specific signal transduction histidine kinase